MVEKLKETTGMRTRLSSLCARKVQLRVVGQAAEIQLAERTYGRRTYDRKTIGRMDIWLKEKLMYGYMAERHLTERTSL